RWEKDPDKCRPDEIFVTCGSACADTCENLHIKERTCTRECIIGCQCRGDLVRNAAGGCVKGNQC
ncbi:chymotrypsin inhibitor-like protein, partial [Dinothrombium tinctorium]